MTSYKKLRKELFKEQQGCCYYCDCEMKFKVMEEDGTYNKDGATIEHLHRVCEGGTDARHNLVLACSTCNSYREDFSPEIWKMACTILIPLIRKRAQLKKKIDRLPRYVRKENNITCQHPIYKFHKRLIKRPSKIVINNYYNLIITLIIKKAEKELTTF